MKINLWIPLLCTASLLSGCMRIQLDETPAEHLGEAVQTANIPSETAQLPEGLLTKQEAEAIALKHAGFSADEVKWLRSDYEIDDGIHQYEVQFHQGSWEYDYEINAKTGEILSYDRDD